MNDLLKLIENALSEWESILNQPLEVIHSYATVRSSWGKANNVKRHVLGGIYVWVIVKKVHLFPLGLLVFD